MDKEGLKQLLDQLSSQQRNYVKQLPKAKRLAYLKKKRAQIKSVGASKKKAHQPELLETPQFDVKGLTRMEREVIIRIAEDENTWDIVSHSPKFIRKMYRCGWLGSAYGGSGMHFTLPGNMITIRKNKDRVKSKPLPADHPWRKAAAKKKKKK